MRPNWLKLTTENLNSSNTDGSFTVANSNSFWASWNSSDSSWKEICKENFLFYHGIVYRVYSLESSHRGDSNEYTHHYCVENRKGFPKLSLSASWPGAMINPQWLELPISRINFMVPKMFQPFRFYCSLAQNRWTHVYGSQRSFLLEYVWILFVFSRFPLQKARQARIRMAKNASGAAFLNSKKRAEEMLLAQETGLDINDAYSDQDIFNMQHHHLLNCLEKTTVSKIK